MEQGAFFYHFQPSCGKLLAIKTIQNYSPLEPALSLYGVFWKNYLSLTGKEAQTVFPLLYHIKLIFLVATRRVYENKNSKYCAIYQSNVSALSYQFFVRVEYHECMEYTHFFIGNIILVFTTFFAYAQKTPCSREYGNRRNMIHIVYIMHHFDVFMFEVLN